MPPDTGILFSLKKKRSQARKRHRGNVNAYYKVKEANAQRLPPEGRTTAPSGRGSTLGHQEASAAAGLAEGKVTRQRTEEL